MGLKNILFINQDAFLGRRSRLYEDEELCTAVGEAVLKACDQQRQIVSGQKFAPLLGHGNAVYFVDQVDQTLQRVYLWGGNTLRHIPKLDDKNLAIVDKIVQTLKKSRGL